MGKDELGRLDLPRSATTPGFMIRRDAHLRQPLSTLVDHLPRADLHEPFRFNGNSIELDQQLNLSHRCQCSLHCVPSQIKRHCKVRRMVMALHRRPSIRFFAASRIKRKTTGRKLCRSFLLQQLMPWGDYCLSFDFRPFSTTAPIVMPAINQLSVRLLPSEVESTEDPAV